LLQQGTQQQATIASGTIARELSVLSEPDGALRADDSARRVRARTPASQQNASILPLVHAHDTTLKHLHTPTALGKAWIVATVRRREDLAKQQRSEQDEGPER
jgi:hypothetical protein